MKPLGCKTKSDRGQWYREWEQLLSYNAWLNEWDRLQLCVKLNAGFSLRHFIDTELSPNTTLELECEGRHFTQNLID